MDTTISCWKNMYPDRHLLAQNARKQLLNIEWRSVFGLERMHD